MLKEYRAVRYELLRPGQVKSIREECPIAYMPAGSLEWHGVQNPLGTDGLKAHAICCDAALHHGGIVLPTFFLGMVGEGLGWGPEGWRGYTLANNTREMMLAAMRGAAKALVQSGWKVIVGVTGHDVKAQRDVMHEAIQQAIVDTDAKGFAVTEGENWEGGDAMPYSMDHAGAWETSIMMHAHPDNVDLQVLRLEMGDRVGLDRTAMKEPEGIGGYNPLKYASAELGEQIVRFCADRIGRKAQDVLAGRAEPLSKADKAFMDNPGPTDRAV